MGKVVCILMASVVSYLLPFQIASGQSAAQEISVLGAKLNIGMTKATAFSPFNTYHTTVRVGDSGLLPECDSWLIQSNGPPYTPYANLYFK